MPPRFLPRIHFKRSALNKPNSKVAKGAQGPQTEDVDSVHRLLPTKWIHFAISALPALRIKAWAITTVHTQSVNASLLFGAALGASWLGQAPPEPPTLRLDGNRWVISQNGQQTSVPMLDDRSPIQFGLNTMRLEHEGRTVIFDQRGIGLGRETLNFSRLPSVATSDRLFSAEEIETTRSRIAAGQRRAEVSALSGAELVGTQLYLLLRWDESNGTPWLEAVVRLNLADSLPQAEVIGKFEGFSFARGLVGNQLRLLRPGVLATPARKDGSWGISLLDVHTGTTIYREIGRQVSTASLYPEQNLIVTQSLTPYGTLLIGIANLETNRHRYVDEVRGRLVGFEPDGYIRFMRGEAHFIRNVLSGAERQIPIDSQVRGTSQGLLLWSPAANPNNATLLDPNSLTSRARWAR